MAWQNISLITCSRVHKRVAISFPPPVLLTPLWIWCGGCLARGFLPHSAGTIPVLEKYPQQLAAVEEDHSFTSTYCEAVQWVIDATNLKLYNYHSSAQSASRPWVGIAYLQGGVSGTPSLARGLTSLAPLPPTPPAYRYTGSPPIRFLYLHPRPRTRAFAATTTSASHVQVCLKKQNKNEGNHEVAVNEFFDVVGVEEPEHAARWSFV
ncbi:hypothetical protein HOY82DRAFT_592382 [Tuber indicum]|nr:hypothetical protein HOY82DRAFT_592382 [Tuber indicum]